MGYIAGDWVGYNKLFRLQELGIDVGFLMHNQQPQVFEEKSVKQLQILQFLFL